MDDAKLFAISAAGMAAERARIDVAALNLANANTVQTPDGLAFRPMRAVARSSVPSPMSFVDRVEQGMEDLGLMGIGLPEVSVEPSGAAPRLVHDPGHPFADAKGDVAYPGVDPATEMVTLMSALRAYEANVAAMNVTRSLVLKTLELGGGA
jgi:flagellar basal-body rod protein FlgC